MSDQILTKSGVIESSKQVKNGEKNGKPWSIHEVWIDGEKFQAWQDCSALIGKGNEWKYKVESSTGRNGTVYTNKTLIFPKKELTPTTQDLEGRVRTLEQYVKKLWGDVDELKAGRGASLGAAVKALKDDINPEDLPF